MNIYRYRGIRTDEFQFYEINPKNMTVMARRKNGSIVWLSVEAVDELLKQHRMKIGIPPVDNQSMFIGSNIVNYGNGIIKTIIKDKTMKHLATHNNWIIALDQDCNLVAFNDKGEYIKGKPLISAGGRAWMYKYDELWSGELTRVVTDEDKKKEKILAARKRHDAKIEKARAALQEKMNKAIEARNAEIARLESE